MWALPEGNMSPARTLRQALVFLAVWALGASAIAVGQPKGNPPPTNSAPQPEKFEAPRAQQIPIDGVSAPVDPKTYIIGP